jgi:hypothetical protein
VEGFCEHGDEPSGFITEQDIFDKLSDIQLSSNILAVE